MKDLILISALESNKIENEFSPINGSKGKNNSVHSQENQEITESLNRYVSPTSNNQVSSQNANLSQIESRYIFKKL